MPIFPLTGGLRRAGAHVPSALKRADLREGKHAYSSMAYEERVLERVHVRQPKQTLHVCFVDSKK